MSTPSPISKTEPSDLPPCEPPICAICGKTAACFGAYEDPEATPSYACNSCCGHGNEDGWCEPVNPSCQQCTTLRSEREEAKTRAEKAESEADGLRAEVERLSSLLEGIAGEDTRLLIWQRFRGPFGDTQGEGLADLVMRVLRERAQQEKP